MKKVFTVMALFALGFCSCKKGTTDPIVTPVTPVTPTVATNLDNAVLLKLVNDTRISGCMCGTTTMPPVTALAWNNSLAAAALEHSKDMNKNNYFEHDSPSGSTIANRLDAQGYKWSAYGENLASGQTTEQQVFNDWLKSEGHCKNMMNSAFKEMGAARDGNYWTQDFGTQR